MQTEQKDISLKELKECRLAFEKEYADMGHMLVDPRPGGLKWCKDFVNEMTQARWCAWQAGWQYRANREPTKSVPNAKKL